MLSKVSFRYRNQYDIRGAMRSWTPAEITTAIWYDANDNATITASGGNVSQWDDKSGNGRHLTTVGGSGNIVTGTRTIGGLNVLDFPGTANLTRTAFSTTENNGWAFLVIASDATTFTNSGGARFANFALDGTNNRLYSGVGTTYSGFSDRAAGRFDDLTFANDILASATITTSPFILNFGRAYQSNAVLYINGVSQGSKATLTNTNTHTTQSVSIGGDANGYLDGVVGEVILLKTSPTTETRQLIEGYLAWKWGIEANLPVGHPYKDVAPRATTGIRGVPLWTPAYAATSLWLDASDSATLYDATTGGSLVAANGQVARWEDKSGNGRHFTQSTAGYRPVRKTAIRNSKDVLLFDGLDDGLESTTFVNLGTQHAIVAVAFSANYTTKSMAIFASRSNTLGPPINPQVSVNGTVAGDPIQFAVRDDANTGLFANVNNTIVDSTWNIFGGDRNSNSIRNVLNGTEIGTASGILGTITTNISTIGYLYSGSNFRSAWWDSYIAEIVIVPITSRQLVEGYLAWKWGLEVNLPASHPYKNAAPQAPIGIGDVPLWTPSLMTSSLWLDFSDSSTLFDATSGGSPVTNGVGIARAEDKSGNGRHFTQATAEARPTWTSGVQNSLGIARYDGGDWLTSISANSTWNFLHNSQSTIIAVWKPGSVVNPNAYYGLIGNLGNTSSNLGYQFGYENRSIITGSNNAVGIDVSTPNGIRRCAWHFNPGGSNPIFSEFNNLAVSSNFGINCAVADPGNATAANRAKVNLNGGSLLGNQIFSDTPSLSNATHALQIGAVGNDVERLDGDIAEICVFNRAISVGERQLMEGYLAWKWGLEANLPVSHPYKNAAPRAPIGIGGEVGWWCPSLDDAGNGTTILNDLTGNSNEGILTNMDPATDWVADTASGGVKALDFDGSNDHIIIGDVLDSIFTGASAKFTVSAHIYVDGSGNRGIIGKLGDGATGGGDNREWILRVLDGQLDFAWYGSLNATSYRVIRTNTSITYGQWTHILVTFDASVASSDDKAEIYINGIKQSVTFPFTSGSPVSIQNGSARLSIGAAIGPVGALTAYPFDGKVDDIRVFNRALTAQEISLLASKRGDLYNYTRLEKGYVPYMKIISR